jgi:hypothetical protein
VAVFADNVVDYLIFLMELEWRADNENEILERAQAHSDPGLLELALQGASARWVDAPAKL